MSKLTTALPTAESLRGSRRGPSGACDVYKGSDLDDVRTVQARRLSTNWAEAEDALAASNGVKHIGTDKFRYHWNGKCWHWTDEQKREITQLLAELGR